MKKIIHHRFFKRVFLVVSMVTLVIYLAYQLIYPTMICKGQFNKVRVWTNGSNKEVTKLLDDEHLEVSWSLLFSRGAIIINEDRFPLYKELNSKNNFAKSTAVGYEGSYSTDFLQHIRYDFSYNQIANQLSVSFTGKGDHILDGDVGMDDLKANFIGTCQRKWF
ncbi:hypothetical protein [Polynucleobacter sp. UB-Siik-W21]|uniref:hypothetical protein n=1 Tax=Polynucleobacter sp. UB-Siik-W21 TaxID=1855646 RepID=UPI001BFEE025|nr:hypothetical protein [Polynucleobacter sp. UB-Siik-W21]QWD69611.1 hypothetical protein C2756_06700 [Polynucleobacter sp. UB-Siik-W21]